MRDIDFARKKAVVQTPSMPAEKITQFAKERRSGSRAKVWIWLIIIVLIASTGVFLYYHFKPSPVSRNSTTVSGTKATDADLQKQPSQTLTSDQIITLYDAGAGQEATSDLNTTLKNQGYSVSNLGSSQFQLDQTYIWYGSGYSADAQKIANLLTGKKVSLRQYVGTGPYKILIQLGP